MVGEQSVSNNCLEVCSEGERLGLERDLEGAPLNFLANEVTCAKQSTGSLYRCGEAS